MDIFAFIPAFITFIIAVYSLSNIFDKKDELTWRVWKLVFGILFTLLTIYFVNLGIREIHRVNKNNNSYIYYNNYY
jgi:hypothetical protein